MIKLDSFCMIYAYIVTPGSSEVDPSLLDRTRDFRCLTKILPALECQAGAMFI